MQNISIVTDYKIAAEECASYIIDSECMQMSYEEHIQSGLDPRDHILYCAAVVLGKQDEFDIDILEYLNGEKDCE